ncbi:MAG TPA: hypothetical protein VJ995_01670 [Geothermobacteraceae bacterium]|nr:hypothetical protein [Geothermobacteraceae bacterium]
MIYIGTTESPGQAIYLDIHAIEQQGNQTSVSALVGDGCYEGEVLIEFADQPAVTYADTWLGGAGLDEFLQRAGQAWLRKQLLDSVQDHLAVTNVSQKKSQGVDYPHQMPLPRGRVAEAKPIWNHLA